MQPASSDDLIYQQKRWKQMLRKSQRKPKPIKKQELENDCLFWTGCKNEAGYGYGKYKGKSRGIHIISWIIHNQVDDVPQGLTGNKKLQIRHVCDQPACMEPTHLRIGTALKNGQDKRKSGSGQGINATITRELAEQIKWSKQKPGEPGYRMQKQRAKDFGVSLGIVRHIDCGNNWAHIPQKDGIINRTKANQQSEKRRKSRKEAKEKIWTEAQWKTAENKLQNKQYTKRHPTRSYNGVSCREWMKGKIHGYPRISIHGQTFLGHRLACIIGNNYKDCPGLQAAHECGFSSCVEPTHLSFKTAYQNAMDKHTHNTMSTKLTKNQVIAIRKQYKNCDVIYKMLAQKYNVSRTTIGAIVRRERWTHI